TAVTTPCITLQRKRAAPQSTASIRPPSLAVVAHGLFGTRRTVGRLARLPAAPPESARHRSGTDHPASRARPHASVLGAQQSRSRAPAQRAALRSRTAARSTQSLLHACAAS